MGMSRCSLPNAYSNGLAQAGAWYGWIFLHACFLPPASWIPLSLLFTVFKKECVCILPVQCPAFATIYSTLVVLPAPGQRGD